MVAGESLLMNLSTMRDVVTTLGDDLGSPIADELMRSWGNDGSRPRYRRASANFVFFFTENGHGRVLRFNHESERDSWAIEAELAAIEHISGRGTSVARPIRSAAGRLVETATIPQGTYHAVVFEQVMGEQIDLEDFFRQTTIFLQQIDRIFQS